MTHTIARQQIVPNDLPRNGVIPKNHQNENDHCYYEKEISEPNGDVFATERLHLFRPQFKPLYA